MAQLLLGTGVPGHCASVATGCMAPGLSLLASTPGLLTISLLRAPTAALLRCTPPYGYTSGYTLITCLDPLLSHCSSAAQLPCWTWALPRVLITADPRLPLIQPLSSFTGWVEKGTCSHFPLLSSVSVIDSKTPCSVSCRGQITGLTILFFSTKNNKSLALANESLVFCLRLTQTLSSLQWTSCFCGGPAFP